MSGLMRPGPRNLITDVAGLLVGSASDTRLKSGATVLTAAEPFVAAIDVMGGAPGSRETDLLAPTGLVTRVDAIVLSGGSAFGLDAASGVADRLRALGRGFRAGAARVPIVPAAILFDLNNGGDKHWDANPYPALGRAAYDAARPHFALGRAGAGAGAMTATLMGGLGSASALIEDRFTVGALVAVNALGSVTVPDGREFWAAHLGAGEDFGGVPPAGRRTAPEIGRSRKPGAIGGGSNTTIAVVATDAALDRVGALHLATMAQDGIARAIHPAHTPHDGDLVFGVATGARPLGDAPSLDLLALGHAAAFCLARAIARAVHAARPEPGDLLPCWCQLSD
jgi:L-aminopeptidase/D-esterase-like protein